MVLSIAQMDLYRRRVSYPPHSQRRTVSGLVGSYCGEDEIRGYGPNYCESCGQYFDIIPVTQRWVMGVPEHYFFAGGMGGRVVLPCMTAFHS